MGIMLAEHDARPHIKKTSCVIVLRANTQLIYFVCVQLRTAVRLLGSLTGTFQPKT